MKNIMKINILLCLITLSYFPAFAGSKLNLIIAPVGGMVEYYYVPEDNKSIIIGINYYLETGFAKESKLVKVTCDGLNILWECHFNSKITEILADKNSNYIAVNGFISEEKGSYKYIVNGITGQVVDSLYQAKMAFLNANGRIIYTSDRMMGPGVEYKNFNHNIYVKDIKSKHISETLFSWPVVCFYKVRYKMYLVASANNSGEIGENKYINLEDGKKALTCPVTTATSDTILIYCIKDTNAVDLMAEIKLKIFFDDAFCYGVDDSSIIIDNTNDMYGYLYNFQGDKEKIPIIDDVEKLKKSKYICPRYYEYTSDFYYKDLKNGRIYSYNITSEEDSMLIKSIFNNLSNNSNKITLQNNFLINSNKKNIIIGKIINGKKMEIIKQPK